MKLHLFVFLIALICVSSGAAQAINDGTGDYAKTLIDFHAQTGATLAKKKDTQPFAVALFGWKALTLAQLPYNSYEGGHIKVCGIVVGFYDQEISSTFATVAARPSSTKEFVKASESEIGSIQKFVVQKYNKKYVFDIDNIAANPKMKDPVSAWKYSLGSNLGELAGKLTQWFSLPNNANFETSVAENLRNLDAIIKEAPRGTSADLIDNLKKLNALGAKNKFTPQERQQIGTALKQTLLSTMSFVSDK